MQKLMLLALLSIQVLSSFAQRFQADNSFGNLNSGRTLFTYKGEWRAIDRQGENYIVVGKGELNNTYSQAIMRFHSNGENEGGNTFFSFRIYEGAFFDVAVAADSTIYACGVKQDSGTEEFYLVKFDKNGTKIHEIWLPNNVLSIAYRLKLLPNHDILVCGRTSVAGENRARVAKLHDDGVSFSLVSTFGTNGFAKIEDAKDFSFVPGASCCYALDVSANGKIYAAGSYVQRNSANTSPQPFFSYWKANGTPDTVVRGYSVTSTQNGPANEIYDIIAKDSNLYSAGYTFFNPKFVANGAVRVLNDGLTYRQSQNGLQAMVTPLTATQNYMPFSQYNSVAVETSGAYYFGGIGDSATSPHVCIGKIDMDMEPDTTFNFGFANYALPFDTYEQPSAEIANDALVDVTPSGEESFVLVGSETFHSDGQAHPMIVKVITKKVAGINNALSNDGIEIFPNPASQSLQIKAEVIQHIAINDVTGKEIYSNTAVNAKTYSIAVSALSPAIYFITVNGNSPKKFIKID